MLTFEQVEFKYQHSNIGADMNDVHIGTFIHRKLIFQPVLPTNMYDYTLPRMATSYSWMSVSMDKTGIESVI